MTFGRNCFSFIAALGFFLTAGCVSFHDGNKWNEFYMPVDQAMEQLYHSAQYNCIVVQGVMGSPENVDFYLERQEHDNYFEYCSQSDNDDLYAITQDRDIHIPFTVCRAWPNQEFINDKNTYLYCLDFHDAWAFGTGQTHLLLRDTKTWARFQEGDNNACDSIRVHLVMKDNTDGLDDILRNIFTLGIGCNGRMDNAVINLKPGWNILERWNRERPKCLGKGD